MAGGPPGSTARSSTAARAPPAVTLVMTVSYGPAVAATPSSAASRAGSAARVVCSQTWAPWDWVKIRCQGLVA